PGGARALAHALRWIGKPLLSVEATGRVFHRAERLGEPHSGRAGTQRLLLARVWCPARQRDDLKSGGHASVRQRETFGVVVHSAGKGAATQRATSARPQ